MVKVVQRSEKVHSEKNYKAREEREGVVRLDFDRPSRKPASVREDKRSRELIVHQREETTAKLIQRKARKSTSVEGNHIKSREQTFESEVGRVYAPAFYQIDSDRLSKEVRNET